MNMEYWDGTFKFEYDSCENENYVSKRRRLQGKCI